MTRTERDPFVVAVQARLPALLRPGLDGTGPGTPLAEALAAIGGAARANRADAAGAFDPATAHDAMLPWLSALLGWGWLFVDPDDPRRRLALVDAFPPGADRLRALLWAAPRLRATAGHGAGLALTLRIATGFDAITVTQDVAAQHLHVRTPPLPPGWGAFVARLVRAERPVHLTWSTKETPA